MKRKSIAAALALALTISAAHAEGFSVGASIGSSSIEIDDQDSGIDFDNSTIGWKVFGKYMFSNNWGLEVGYVDFGNPDDTVLGIKTEIGADGIDGFLIGSVPASESIDLFGKAGFIAWDAEITVPGVASVEEDGTDLALGIGAVFHASDNFSILGEWEWFDISDADTVWMLSVGLEFGFN